MPTCDRRRERDAALGELASKWPFSWICRLFSGAVPFMMAWMRDIFVVTACSSRRRLSEH